MDELQGHVQLERAVDSIIVGIRHRHDLGDLDPLMRSISERGLLQPITVTPDGVLVCGRRRLEAVKQLGWRTLRVWVRSGISTALARLLAEQDENELRKPLTPEEMSDLYIELKKLMREDAERRQAATRFGSEPQTGEEDGGVDSTPPGATGKTRDQAALQVCGQRSWQRLDRVAIIKDVTQDAARSAALRDLAAEELRRINEGADVAPAYERVRTAIRLSGDPRAIDAKPISAEELSRQAKADLTQDAGGGRPPRQRRSPAVTRTRSLRAFLLVWGELDGWSRYYNPTDIAAGLTPEDWAMFQRVIKETAAFADEVRELRTSAALETA